MIPRAKRRALVQDWVRRRNAARAERNRQQAIGMRSAFSSLRTGGELA